MRPLAAAFFKKYTIDHEGFTPFMYADTLNLITTGIGNLIDASARNSFDTSAAAMAPAMGLPWKFRGAGWTSKNPIAIGSASPNDIANAWTVTKLQEQKQPGFNQKGGFAYAGLTPLTLDMDGISALVARQTASNENVLRKNYPNYESLPADAQLALNSMSWAMGASFWPVLKTNGVPTFQAFKNDIDRSDFISAATHSQFKGGGSITDPKSRNHDLDIMFRNAAASVKAGADPSQLFFPGTGPSGLGGIAGVSSPLITPGHVAGGAIAAGLIGYGLYDWWKSRK